MQKAKLMICSILITVILVLSTLPLIAQSESDMYILVNDKQLLSSLINMDGTLYIEAKEFIEALGGRFSFDKLALAGTIGLGENEMVFRLDNGVAKLNGKNVSSPDTMKVIGLRYMIPVAFVAKQLGCEFYINTYRKCVLVYKPLDSKVTYQVMSGDTLWIISQVFGTTISSIKQSNKLTNDMIYVGQKLVIKDFSPVSNIFSAVTSTNATLSSGTGLNYPAVGYLSAWSNINIIGKVGNWFKVITSKGTGYVHSSVTYIKQEIADSSANSTYFKNRIPIDTSKDYITYDSYIAQKGDSVWSISEKVAIPDYELAQANNISAYSTLSIGQEIKVPVHNIPVKDKIDSQFGEVLDWFKEGQYVLSIGRVGKLIDLETGKSFNIKRTMGANHSDTETLTIEDAKIMKEVFGGVWNWNRRPFILEIEGRRFAVSVAGMPHAGIDGVAFMQNTENRSNDWGYGPNYDRIPGNGMDGHFDLYFLNCLTHKDNSIDSSHQFGVLTAGGLH